MKADILDSLWVKKRDRHRLIRTALFREQYTFCDSLSKLLGIAHHHTNMASFYSEKQRDNIPTEILLKKLSLCERVHIDYTMCNFCT